jgi:hypothetical protein
LGVDDIAKTLNDNPCCELPLGPKNNVMFVISNEKNINMRSLKLRSEFPDDMGAWKTIGASCAVTYLTLIGNHHRQLIKTKAGLYIIPGKNKTLLNPQPDENSIIILHRYYLQNKSDTNFRKRISYFTSYPANDTITQKALVEYLGVFSGDLKCHGNAVHYSRPYVRTDPRVLNAIRDRPKSTPAEVYTDMCTENPALAPRDIVQVKNTRYNVKRQEREIKYGKAAKCINLADNVELVLNMVGNHPFVQRAVYDSQKTPMFILHTADQLADLNNCLSKGDCVIGIDRTFNLGQCFVTITVFKHSAVIRNVTQEHPIFFGPMFLHWNGSRETYHTFFSYLSARLNVNNINQIEHAVSNMLIFGSDEEKGITSALKECFPKSLNILCTRHVKENLIRYLRDKVGMSNRKRDTLVEQIFHGDSCLMSSVNVDSYDAKCISILADIGEVEVIQYLEKQIFPSLKNNIVAREHYVTLPKTWTNNNCESANNILKRAAKWTPKQLPELVDMLYR